VRHRAAGSITRAETTRLPSHQHILSRNTAAKFKCEIFAASPEHNVSINAGNVALTYVFIEVVSHSLLP
jgi:hypothetical protein